MERAVDARLETTRARPSPSKLEFARFSLWAGVVGFGGGLSVLAILRSRAVTEKGWVTEREFDNTATVAQMLPGGAAANALALLGMRFFGTEGAVGAYATFIFPGFVAILALAGFYTRLAGAPHVQAFLGGLNAAVAGIVAAITLQMIRSSVARFWQVGVAGVALALSLEGGGSPGEVALLGICAGLFLDVAMKRARLARTRKARAASPPVALPDEGEPLRRRGASELQGDATAGRDASELRSGVLVPLAVALAMTAGAGMLLSLFILFLRTGLGAYGGGFAIVPHLQATLVGGGELTDRQFADAVAIGKLTPGPVLLMATFIGYVKEGLAGALVATAAIFAAPLVLTIALGRWLARHRSRRSVRAALRGLTPAVVGMMAAAALTLAMSLDGTRELAIAVAVGMTLTRFRVNPVLMLVIGGAAGALLSRVG